MYYTTPDLVVLCLGLLGIVVDASPTNIESRHVPRQRSNLVPRVKNANFEGYDGPTELLKTYRKYDMPVPRALLAASERRKFKRAANSDDEDGPDNGGTGSVTATPQKNGINYVSPIIVGGQTISIDFDTGSSDLWVFGHELDARSPVSHQAYDANKSDSAIPLPGSSFNCTYADGTGVAGTVVEDVVEIGGVTATQQAVGVATAVSQKSAHDASSNGLLGLAFSSLNSVQPEKQNTFFDNVMSDLAEPVFTADLRKADDGAYEFGRIDDTKYARELAWVPIDPDSGFWQFTSDKYAVDGGPAQTSNLGAQAIVDTGTTIIAAHLAVVEAYYARVDGAVNDTEEGGFVFPCKSELPGLGLDVGGVYTARIPGSDIKFSQYNDEMCFGGLQESPTDVQIFGDIFLKSQFVAFHGGNHSIGVAMHSFREHEMSLSTPSADRGEQPLTDLVRPKHGKRQWP